jgi:hypothetical protein
MTGGFWDFRDFFGIFGIFLGLSIPKIRRFPLENYGHKMIMNISYL